MTNFRSQCGEDKWLAANWQALGLPERGVFVDFGAGDGETFSNSYWLEKEMGWRGLLCEPDPRHVISDRPNSIIERVAVGPPGRLTLALTVDPYLTSSLRGDCHDEPRLAVCERIEVESVPLSALLDMHGFERVDLISVDTEGTEEIAWRTLDLSRWRPRIAIVEYSTWQIRDDFDGIRKVWEADGYELLHTTIYNCIFKSR